MNKICQGGVRLVCHGKLRYRKELHCHSLGIQSLPERIESAVRSLPVVNQDMDLILSQKEPTTYGVPIQVYFFSRNKVWREYERIQSDIFDHLLVMVQKFDLKLYQYSD